jgi:hypothetical protein
MREPPHELAQRNAMKQVLNNAAFVSRQQTYMRWYLLSGLIANISLDMGSKDASR